MKEQVGQYQEGISSDTNVPRQGIGHAIGVLFKAFFLFISVIITFALVMALIGLIFTGAGSTSAERIILSMVSGRIFWPGVCLFYFLLLPVIGILTWLIRRIIGVQQW